MIPSADDWCWKTLLTSSLDDPTHRVSRITIHAYFGWSSLACRWDPAYDIEPYCWNSVRGLCSWLIGGYLYGYGETATRAMFRCCSFFLPTLTLRSLASILTFITHAVWTLYQVHNGQVYLSSYPYEGPSGDSADLHVSRADQAGPLTQHAPNMHAVRTECGQQRPDL